MKNKEQLIVDLEKLIEEKTKQYDYCISKGYNMSVIKRDIELYKNELKNLKDNKIK